MWVVVKTPKKAVIILFSTLSGLGLVLGVSACNPIFQTKIGPDSPIPFTKIWPFDATPDPTKTYAFDATKIDFTGGVCRLTAADHADDANDSAGFLGSTLVGTAWNSTSGFVVASNAGGCDGLNSNCNPDDDLKSSWMPQPASLTALWHLNEAAATAGVDNDFQDSSSGGNYQESQGGVTFGTAGKLTNGASFTGTGTSYLMSASTVSNNPPYTVCAWTNSTAMPPAATQTVVSNGSGIANRRGFSIYLNTSSKFNFSVQDNTSSTAGTAASGLSATLGWNHVCGTWDGTTGTGAVIVYLNGVSVGSTTAGASGVPGAIAQKVNIGMNTGLASPWIGKLDEVSIWSTVLSPSEIAGLYARQAPRSGVITSRVMDAFAVGMSWSTLSWVSTLPFFKELPDFASASLQNEKSADYSSLVGMTGNVGEDNLMSGLIGLWHLNESGYVSGTTQFKDDSGNGYAAVLTSGGTVANEATNCAFGNCFQQTAGTVFSCGNPKALTTASIPMVNLFTYSVWVKLMKSTTLGSGDGISIHQVSGTSRWSVQATGAGGTFGLSIQTSGGSGVTGPSAAINDGKWHLLTYVVNNGVTNTYTDGKFTVAGSYVVGTGFAGSIPFSLVWGCGISATAGAPTMQLDEIGYWSRGLDAKEIMQLYRRGANRIKYQVRNCTSSDCSDDLVGANWKGSDGTAKTYLSELNNNTVPLNGSGDVKRDAPALLLSSFTAPVGTSQFFQYRAILESDDAGTSCNYGAGATACLPELKSVKVDPIHYSAASPTVIAKSGVSFTSLSSFVETLGAGCSAGVGYNLGMGSSYASATWYWWNASTSQWVTANGTATQSNSAAVIQSHVATFGAQAGTGTVYFKAFFNSSGSTQCELDNLNLEGQ